jgi:hypothetical protein
METPVQYQTTNHNGQSLPRQSQPLDPRWRVLLIAIRRGLLVISEAIAEICELKK